MPTSLAVESNLNNPNQSLRILSDSTDSQGIRHVELQTTATGNDPEGYNQAERQAHSWFFAAYDPVSPSMDTEARTESAIVTAEIGLSSGRITEEWLTSSHPVINTRKKAFMFGHHTGINPRCRTILGDSILKSCPSR